VRDSDSDFAKVRIFHMRRPFRFLSLIRSRANYTRISRILRTAGRRHHVHVVDDENGAESRRASVSLN